MVYTCSTCEKTVNGFHDCKKIIKEEIKDCGCKVVLKEGFYDLFSVCIEQFEYTYPCSQHKFKTKRKT